MASCVLVWILWKKIELKFCVVVLVQHFEYLDISSYSAIKKCLEVQLFMTYWLAEINNFW